MKIVILLKENWSHIAKIWIFLNGGDVDENRHITKFWIFFNRGDVVENRHFIDGKVVAHGQIFQWRHVDENCHFMKRNWSHMATCHEFDLIGERCEKNDDFQKEKQHIEGYTRFVMGAMFMKIIILLKKKSHMSKYYLMIIFCSIKFSRTKLVPYL